MARMRARVQSITVGAALFAGALGLGWLGSSVTGCSETPAGSDGAIGSDMAQPPDASLPPLSFQIEKVSGCGSAGYQTVIATGPSGTVGVATLASTSQTTSCQANPPVPPPPQPVDVTLYQICYAESVGGAAFTTTVAATQAYASDQGGLGMAIDSAGRVLIAYPGGGFGSVYCLGGSDLMRTERPAGGSFSTPATVIADSMATLGGNQSQFCNGALQDVCQKGDVTGLWPSVAFDATGAPAIAFCDNHFGWAETDFSKSDLELARGTGYGVVTIEAAQGGGWYPRIAFDSTNKAVIAHYNLKSVGETGLYVDREVGTDTYSRNFVGSASIEPPFGFSIGPSDVLAIAYYDGVKKHLYYVESTDQGVTWGTPDVVDDDGIVGMRPSLAFGPNGEPAIAYYRCNDFQPGTSSCSASKDGLRLARRAGGKWTVDKVSAQAGTEDGDFPALAFVGGKAVIAFQTRTFDPSTATTVVQLNVARQQ